MTETAPPPPGSSSPRARSSWLLPSLALALAIGSALLPVLALPAIIAVIVVAARSPRPARLVVALLGGIAATIGLGRFTLEWAVPNIVSSGQFAAEERAVSRLREILWSEDRVRERRWVDSNGDGQGEYAFLGELTGATPQRRNGARVEIPLIRPDQFHPADAHGVAVYRSEGYVFTVYLPGPAGAPAHEPGSTSSPAAAVDGNAAARYWVAYAWPAERDRGGRRAFYIDQDDRICQTDNAQGYSGADRIPAAAAAISTAPGAEPCGTTTGDGGSWRPWKKKRPRGEKR